MQVDTEDYKKIDHTTSEGARSAVLACWKDGYCDGGCSEDQLAQGAAYSRTFAALEWAQHDLHYGVSFL
ncbi:hypothetical protein EAF00_001524 [Botryotinia globosa]|nr:hypothetical protein EAF00_001524 [Botryotinia globosa]